MHNTGDASETYHYAAEHFASMAGDPTFDYYYGIAAIDTGHASQGVFALERVLAAAPQSHAARLELARGYFLLEEFSRARFEFETVLAADPPTSVRARIDRYLYSIRKQEGRYKTSSNGFAELGFGRGNNINNAPEDQIAGGFTLDNPALADSYATVAAAYQISPPISPGRAFFTGIGVDYQSNFDKTDFNSGNVRLNAGLTSFDDLERYRLELNLQQYYLEDQVYRNSVSVLGEWRRRTSQSRRVNFFARLSDITYPDFENRDAIGLTIGAGITQNLVGSLSPVLYGSVYLGQDSADGSDQTAQAVAERNFGGFQLGAQITTSPRTRLVSSVSLSTDRYAEERVIPGEADRKREDDLTTFNAEFIWLVSRSLSLRSALKYSDNSSNIEVFEYDGLSADIRLRYDLN